MEKLRSYLNSLPPREQNAFCERCGTSLGYLRKALSTGQKLGESLCINIERESSRSVLCEDLRPEVDWAYLRQSASPEPHKPRLRASPSAHEESAKGENTDGALEAAA